MVDKKLTLKVKEDVPFHSFCRRDEDSKNKLYNILKEDYIAYDNKDYISSFYKREFLEEVWNIDSLNIKSYKNIYYKIEEAEKKAKNLVVIFSSMPDGKNYNVSDINSRMFTKNFFKIKESLNKKTMILRIADINLVVGSFYKNTSNFNDYEQKIQNLIKKIAKDYNIESKRIVLIGGSKGATGALIHGKTLGLKTIISDPILNFSKYINSNNDVAMIKEEFEDIDLIKELNEMKNDKKNIEVFCSERVKETYEEIIKLENVTIINNRNTKINTHPEVTKYSYKKIKKRINKHFRKIF